MAQVRWGRKTENLKLKLFSVLRQLRFLDIPCRYIYLPLCAQPDAQREPQPQPQPESQPEP